MGSARGELELELDLESSTDNAADGAAAASAPESAPPAQAATVGGGGADAATLLPMLSTALTTVAGAARDAAAGARTELADAALSATGAALTAFSQLSQQAQQALGDTLGYPRAPAALPHDSADNSSFNSVTDPTAATVADVATAAAGTTQRAVLYSFTAAALPAALGVADTAVVPSQASVGWTAPAKAHESLRERIAADLATAAQAEGWKVAGDRLVYRGSALALSFARTRGLALAAAAAGRQVPATAVDPTSALAAAMTAPGSALASYAPRGAAGTESALPLPAGAAQRAAVGGYQRRREARVAFVFAELFSALLRSALWARWWGDEASRRAAATGLGRDLHAMLNSRASAVLRLSTAETNAATAGALRRWLRAHGLPLGSAAAALRLVQARGGSALDVFCAATNTAPPGLWEPSAAPARWGDPWHEAECVPRAAAAATAGATTVWCECPPLRLPLAVRGGVAVPPAPTVAAATEAAAAPYYLRVPAGLAAPSLSAAAPPTTGTIGGGSALLDVSLDGALAAAPVIAGAGATLSTAASGVEAPNGNALRYLLPCPRPPNCAHNGGLVQDSNGSDSHHAIANIGNDSGDASALRLAVPLPPAPPAVAGAAAALLPVVTQRGAPRIWHRLWSRATAVRSQALHGPRAAALAAQLTQLLLTGDCGCAGCGYAPAESGADSEFDVRERVLALLGCFPALGGGLTPLLALALHPQALPHVAKLAAVVTTQVEGRVVLRAANLAVKRAMSAAMMRNDGCTLLSAEETNTVYAALL